MEPTGPPTGKIRVANFYLNAKGLPGATLDFYDTSRPSKSDKPLISGLKYGEISAYVSPRAAGPLSDFTGADYAQLYIFQHGCKTFGGNVDGMQDGGNITQTGWVHGQQETLVLGDDEGLRPQPDSTDIAEVEPKKDDTGQSMIITPPTARACLSPMFSASSRAPANVGVSTSASTAAAPTTSSSAGNRPATATIRQLLQRSPITAPPISRSRTARTP
jgi:hypothetical protein